MKSLEGLADFYLRGLFYACISVQAMAAMVRLPQFSAAVFDMAAKDNRAELYR